MNDTAHYYVVCVDCRYKVTDSTRDYTNTVNREAHLISYVFCNKLIQFYLLSKFPL